jgi:hypothetical protein
MRRSTVIMQIVYIPFIFSKFCATLAVSSIALKLAVGKLTQTVKLTTCIREVPSSNLCGTPNILIEFLRIYPQFL